MDDNHIPNLDFSPGDHYPFCIKEKGKKLRNGAGHSNFQ